MQKDNRLYQLAENVLKNSVKLKKGEKIYIEAFGPAVLDLMEIFIRKATELGGVPFYFYNDEHLLKAVIDNASEEQMKHTGSRWLQATFMLHCAVMTIFLLCRMLMKGRWLYICSIIIIPFIVRHGCPGPAGV